MTAAPQVRAGAANPFVLVAAAAQGNLEAQRALAFSALLSFYDAAGNPLPADCIGLPHAAILIEGLAFARMAASHGTDEDENCLLALLSLGAILPPECGNPILAEMIARTSLRGEQCKPDHDDAEMLDVAVNQFADQSPTEAVSLAPAYRQLILESEVA